MVQMSKLILRLQNDLDLEFSGPVTGNLILIGTRLRTKWFQLLIVTLHHLRCLTCFVARRHHGSQPVAHAVLSNLFGRFSFKFWPQTFTLISTIKKSQGMVLESGCPSMLRSSSIESQRSILNFWASCQSLESVFWSSTYHLGPAEKSPCSSLLQDKVDTHRQLKLSAETNKKLKAICRSVSSSRYLWGLMSWELVEKWVRSKTEAERVSEYSKIGRWRTHCRRTSSLKWQEHSSLTYIILWNFGPLHSALYDIRTW